MDLRLGHRCRCGMPNNAAAFTVLSAIGLCNLATFVLFAYPASQITFSYLPLGDISNDTSRHRTNNTLNDPTFLERTLMVEGEKKTQIKKITTLHPKPNKHQPVTGKTNQITITLRPLSTKEPPPTPHFDHHDYNYVVNQPHLCAGVEPPMLVIFVFSSLTNFNVRNAIRDTWGSVARKNVSKDIVRLAFLLGKSLNSHINKLVQAEAANYSDVIQEDFLDTYFNLTLKSVMMLKWVKAYCPRAQFLLKTDDDMFIHVTNLLKYLHVVKKRKRLLFGRLMHGYRPHREKTSKWYAPVATYRERDYPSFLSGTSYGMSMDVARSLLKVALKTPLFHLEDVFITGICARRAGITRRLVRGFTDDKRRTPTGGAFRNAISGHGQGPKDMKKIWQELKSGQEKSSRKSVGFLMSSAI